MKYSIIIGSNRKESQSGKVARFIENQLKARNSENEIYVLDLSKEEIPLWEEGKWTGTAEINKTWEPYSKELASSDAYVFVTPEWSGMATPHIKNIFVMCEAQELAHKPAMLVAVSAGTGGAYPIAELRMSSYKNTHVNIIPEHIIVRHARDVINDFEINENTEKADKHIKERIVYVLKVLEQYAKALKLVRDSNVADFETYPHGM